MNSFQFKRINFFKKSKNSAVNQKGKSTFEKKEPKKNLWKKAIENPFIYMFVFVVLISYLISYIPSKSLPVPEVGEIASTNLVVPDDIQIKDEEITQKRKREAVEAVLPVYNINKNVFLITEERIRQFFNLGREFLEPSISLQEIKNFQQKMLGKYGLDISEKSIRTLIKNKFSKDIEELLISLLGKISAQGIILSKDVFIHKEGEKGFTLRREPGKERPAEVDEIADLEESKEKLFETIDNYDISREKKSLLKELSELFITANVAYDKVETDRRKEQVRENVEPFFYTIKEGKVIIRKGDEVSREDVEQIKIINQNLHEKPSWLSNFIGTFLLFFLLFITIWYYLKSLLDFKKAFKNFVVLGITLILSILFYKLSDFLSETFSQDSKFPLLKNTEAYKYGFSYQFGVLLFAFLTQIPVAVIYVIINSLLVGYLFNSNFYIMGFSLIGGLAAVYGIKNYGKQNRISVFKTGIFLVAPVNMFIIITIHLINEKFGFIELISSDLLMGIFGAVLSASLAFLFLPIYETSFGYLTQAKLFELTNSDLPIFKEMAIQAPGTYHHSLIVASIAEKAAEKIKIDTLLVKAAALYHDIGKIKRPEYFIENQKRNSNVHKELTPSMSTLVIVNHVKEGVERAKKLKLPKKIREIIKQHHGNSLVRYFYQKAKEKYDPEMHKIGDESYRHLGPIPQSKEAGIIMLADASEAASRSLKEPTEVNIKRVITDIFNSCIQDGQLDDCDFTLKELKIIAASFFTNLYSIYHRREKYPDFEFEIEQKKKPKNNKKSNGRNNKPAK
ncbi:MAG: HD family phosphohydrolase [Candidatus Aminicenantaceae bacterium]